MNTIKHGKRTAVVSLAAFVLGGAPPAIAQVTPDGSTATTAIIGAGGKITVDIAAKNASGTSLNRYTDFNVPTAGLDLNNTLTGARTIINEVTSSNPSLIQGQLQVLGPRAHVIVANPNGITVDGGSFVNTGGVALSTGSVSFVTRPVAPGQSQDNAVLTTSGGVLTVGAGGLSGAMTHLELISKELRIQGAVTNSHSSSSSDIRVTAGASSVELDAGVFPTNVTAAWSSSTSGAVANAGAVLVDITRPGGLSASKVQIAVTDTGAGVRSAGTLLASAQDFTLSATGDVTLSGSVGTGRDLLVDASAIAVQTNGDGSGSSLSAARHMDLLADAVDIRGATLRAGTGGSDGDVTLGRNGSAATADLIVAGVQGADDYTMASVTAPGGLGVYAQGRNITIEGASVAVDGAADLTGADLTLRSTVDTVSGDVQTSKMSAGQTTITATGAATLAGFELQGVAGLSMTAASLTATEVNGTELQASSLSSSMGDVTVTTTGAVALTGTDVTAGEDVKMSATAISVDAAAEGTDWRPGSVTAQSGGLVLKATAGGITNRGNTLQGSSAIAGDPDSLGGVTLTATGNITNRSLDRNTLGIVFASTGDLSINAGDALENYAGRLVSNANVSLTAAGDFDNYITKTGGTGTVTNSGFIKTGFWSRLFGGKSRTSSSVDYGDLVIPGTLAYVVANGNVGITAANLRNTGGEIDANAGSITIATGALTNEALTTGRASLQVSCGFTCRSASNGAVTLQGGSMSASQDVTITATGQVMNKGGSILAMREMSVTAPSVRAEAVTTWRAVAMPASAFSVGATRLLRADRGGSFLALGGLVRLNTVDPVEIVGGTVDGSAGEDMPAGSVVTPGVTESAVGGGGRPIGLFH